MPAAAPEPLRSALAGRYRFERELGRGGMATVYLVHDLRHDRALALKLLHPQLAAFLGRERFLREIAVAARLTHPNILPLHDSGEADGLLYYLMPYVAGETLRDRLQKEHALPIDQALRITRDVAAALAYAHDHNVVHRDIKPSNILLQAGSAIVADFGIARAITNSVDEDALTDSGLVLGTPAYMSPEQANAEDIDGRSDIYSLGCVLYEMLAGSPPFSGTSGRALLARHTLDPVPPIRTVRPSVTVAIESVVLKALEKAPADRYATAGELAAELQTTASAAALPAREIGARRPGGRTLLAIALVAAAGWLGWQGLSGRAIEPPAVAVDTARYLVMGDGGSPSTTAVAQLFQDALGRWEGVSVVDQFLVRDGGSGRRARQLGTDGLRALAQRHGAGRIVRIAVAPVGDSLRVQAVLYDAIRPGAAPLGDRSVRVSSDLTMADHALAGLADELLLRHRGDPAPHDVTGTGSLAALQLFASGEDALREWDLAGADSHFTAAARVDGAYARASLWAALTRIWSGQPLPRWSSLAERAATDTLALPARDRRVADAVVALARGDLSASCSRWTDLARSEPRDFIAWYGRADCLRHDDIVVPDPTSPTGWRFRSSYSEMLTSFRQAFLLLPSMHRALSTGSFGSVRALLRTRQTSLRAGRAAPPDTTTFLASPSWTGDSLVLYPVRASEVARGRRTVTPTTPLAIRRQRELFHDISAAWVAAYPDSPEALEALAVSLELLGDPAALDTLRRARRLARTASDSVQLAGREVWLQVKLAIPTRLQELEAARRLADSLLLRATSENPPHPRLLASIAALTGRAHLAARLSRHAAVRGSWRVPPPLAVAAPALQVYAALGGPADSLLALERAVASIIARSIPPDARPRARAEWLAYPATLAFPERRLAAIAGEAGGADYLLNAQAAFARGETADARRMLDRMRPVRLSAPAHERPLDALLPEASLLAALGDAAGAVAWLDPTLDALAATDPQMFADASRAGPLVRAMALRAQLADAAGDRAAARLWGNVVHVLWSDADDFLGPQVERMRGFATRP